LFQIDNPDEFIAMLSASLDVVATVTPYDVRLSRKKARDDDGNAQ
jgi:hypothetical protein